MVAFLVLLFTALIAAGVMPFGLGVLVCVCCVGFTMARHRNSL